jgi:signal peptidase I
VQSQPEPAQADIPSGQAGGDGPRSEADAESLPLTDGGADTAEAPVQPDRPPVRFVHRPSWINRALIASWIAISLALFGCWAGWLAIGGRFFVMETPSMGELAPVGSLVAMQPVASPLRVGEIIVFHPPNSNETYAHEIVAIDHTPAGTTYRTKGVLNRTADAWVLTSADIVGEEAVILPGLGYLLRAMPWLLIGFALSVLAAYFVPWQWRRLALGLFLSVVLAVVIHVFQPLVNGELVSSYGSIHQVGHAHVVPTGVLPTRFSLDAARGVRAAPGQEVLVSGPLGPNGRARISMRAALPWWGWLAMCIICATPLLTLRRARRIAVRCAEI